jgi:hypothetical protein
VTYLVVYLVCHFFGFLFGLFSFLLFLGGIFSAGFAAVCKCVVMMRYPQSFGLCWILDFVFGWLVVGTQSWGTYFLCDSGWIRRVG